MYIKNRGISLIFKLIATLLCLAGLLIVMGFPNPLNWSRMKYYTLQSNVLCLIYFAFSAIFVAVQIRKSGFDGTSVSKFSPNFKGAVMMAITVTLLIYQFMLAGTAFSMKEGDWGNILVHLITPLFMIFFTAGHS